MNLKSECGLESGRPKNFAFGMRDDGAIASVNTLTCLSGGGFIAILCSEALTKDLKEEVCDYVRTECISIVECSVGIALLRVKREDRP